MTHDRIILRATIVAGTLDILSACGYAVAAGHTPMTMLRGVAGALLGPSAQDGGVGAAAIGLALHYAIMTAMAAIYVAAARRLPRLAAHWRSAGVGYGLVTWAAMNLVVLPLRWPDRFPTFAPVALGEQLFSHVALVGLPIAYFARRVGSRG